MPTKYVIHSLSLIYRIYSCAKQQLMPGCAKQELRRYIPAFDH